MGRTTRRLGLIAAPLALGLQVTACGWWPPPTPAVIPVGGVRETVTADNLTAARAGMPDGLLEPAWLPDGFQLVNADYIKVGRHVESVDLRYVSATSYVHIWQTVVSPEELGETDPVPKGEPIAGIGWNANPFAVGRAGQENVVEYSARRPDGRTVTVDTDLREDVISRVLESLYRRTAEGAS